MIEWSTLSMRDIELGDRTLSQKPVKNFVTLIAIRFQNLINELTESRALLKIVAKKHMS